MSNKQVFKKVFEEEFDSNNLKEQILFKFKRKENVKIQKVIKYAVVPICMVFILFLGISMNTNQIDSKNYIGTMKVYAYTMSEDNRIEQTELRDNVKIILKKYNMTISSVPGYPNMFEMDNIDYIHIEVINGSISLWNCHTGEVKNLNNNYDLYDNATIYFNVNDNTQIKLTGIKDKEEVFKKNITISMDDAFNYYATIT